MMLPTIVFALLVATASAAGTCPPQGFDSVRDLDLRKFLDGPWYIQEQMITAYQREAQLYCVRAQYVPNDPANLNRGIQVINSARQGSVTGSLIGSTGSGASSSSNSLVGGSFGIAAFPQGGNGPTSASKLNVGPSFLAGLYSVGVRGTFGPYWVVAVGPSADGSNYDWAIVSGGPPRTNTGAGCAAGPLNPTIFDVNGAGLWLFSRTPVDPSSTSVMRDAAQKLGFDLSVLKKVQQQGAHTLDQPLRLLLLMAVLAELLEIACRWAGCSRTSTLVELACTGHYIGAV